MFQEKCKRNCPHIKCNKKCFEPCRTGEVCNEPCPEKLNCGHACVGLCGEICPPCRTCNKDKELGLEFFDIYLNGEAEDGAR